MKGVGATVIPLYGRNRDGADGTRASKPRRRESPRLGRGDLPLLSNAASVPVASKSSAAVKRNVAAGFRIVVAARIRPFTEVEVRQWRQERRETAEELEGATAARTGGMCSSSRQPPGPEPRSLSATVPASTMYTGAPASPEFVGAPPEGPQASLSVDRVPLPVVEVESDGRTIVLLNPQRLLTDANATAPVRSAFTYDYVYSSFTPRVGLDPRLTGNLALPSSSAQRASDDASYVIADAAKDASPKRAWRPQLSIDTPEQDGLAEAEQVAIYEQLAIPLVGAALQGYNTCMFAYGQTGSGKTYTMMGTARHPGLIPRLCELLFAQVATRNTEAHEGSAASPSPRAAAVVLRISYMEIYNEQVRDLLKQRPKNAILRYRSRFDRRDVESSEYRTLKVRHHPSQGIYVEGLTSVPVSTWAECEEFLQTGNALRTQCSTAMNAKSSRSHAIFQFEVTQREDTGGRVRGREVALEKFSKINLVDLAGSERNAQSRTTGKHLAEANSINASLSTLRRVLEGLVSNCSSNPQALTGGGKNKKNAVIPYRESLLTYVLSDILGGNSLTVMCANVSPGVWNIGETESTLRYATLARGVVNHARLNEAPTARIIREMREQIQRMQEALRKAPNPVHVAELKEGILLSEQLLREMREREDTYELRLQSSEAQQEELRKALASHQAGEAHWRAEAQRQQEELKSLRAALVAATAGSTAADAPKDEESAKSKSCASRPRRLSSVNTPHRLPRLSRGADISRPMATPALSVSADGHSNAGDNLGATWSPARTRQQKQKQSAGRHSSLARSDGGGERSTAAASAVATDLRPSDWSDLKPPEARGTPLAFTNILETTSLYEAVLPGHRGGSAVSASCKARRESCRLSLTGAPHQQLMAKRLPGQSPHPPSQKPQRLCSSHVAFIRRPLRKRHEGTSAAPPTTSTTTEEAAMTPFTAVQHSEPNVQHRGGGGAVAGDDELDEAPSFYQTVTYLTIAESVMEDSRSVSASSYAVLLKEGGEDDKAARDASHRVCEQRPCPKHLPRCSDVPQLDSDAEEVYQSQSTRETLQQKRAGPAQSSCCSLEEALEMERQASTPLSSRWPANSPRIAEARQARAARDRRRSSVTAGSLPEETSRATLGIFRKHGSGCRMANAAHQPSSLLPSLPQQQQAKIDDRQALLLQPAGAPRAAAPPIEDEIECENENTQADTDVDLSRRCEGEGGNDDGDMDSGGAIPLDGLTGTMPADSARVHSGRYPPYPTVEAAAENAVTSTAAASAPSQKHVLFKSIGLKPKQSERTDVNTSGSTPSCDRHYSTVDALSMPAYW
ncbi:hypothetical protein GH5_05600 [Leishmania sp. Ghana 2012 LV757]|uniref:hypothetical protein n=1 Tax=Leishmania sp. Ghana 2012 LV757 TaxID=2803181 RepID=UPI001B6B28F6|nr:hypothetical protein GH5_05600 [Leishmania sp. Ghana 2012 LV757]